MAIQYPLRVEGNVRENAGFVHIRDASDRAIAGGLTGEDAEEIVNALNAQPRCENWQYLHERDAELIRKDGMMCEAHPGLEFEHDPACGGPGTAWVIEGRAAIEGMNDAQPRKKSRKVQIEEQLKASDVTAQMIGGRDDIQYGTHDTIPGGDHVVRLGAARRRG